jgi:hypothetical protein
LWIFYLQLLCFYFSSTEGELLAKKDKSSPWQQTSTAHTVKASQPVEEELPKVIGGVYRPPGAYKPPGLRNKIAMSGGIKGKAPEITSEIAFPSLQAAVQDSKRLVKWQ